MQLNTSQPVGLKQIGNHIFPQLLNMALLKWVLGMNIVNLNIGLTHRPRPILLKIFSTQKFATH